MVIQPTIGIYGAPMGNILCFALCMTLDLVVMSRVIPRRPRYIQVFAKPLAASALMGLGAWAVHGLMSKLFEATGIFMSADPVTHEVLGLSRTGNAAATLLAILVAVVIYGVLGDRPPCDYKRRSDADAQGAKRLPGCSISDGAKRP